MPSENRVSYGGYGGHRQVWPSAVCRRNREEIGCTQREAGLSDEMLELNNPPLV